jgi:hypothetical protein
MSVSNSLSFSISPPVQYFSMPGATPPIFFLEQMYVAVVFTYIQTDQRRAIFDVANRDEHGEVILTSHLATALVRLGFVHPATELNLLGTE